ncbi:MAG: hypothetical protein K2R93_08860 [Gemmatimonadaceae bacterium]|nr:hypothetical protein [Gemmatimonadaceae bacterium]
MIGLIGVRLNPSSARRLGAALSTANPETVHHGIDAARGQLTGARKRLSLASEPGHRAWMRARRIARADALQEVVRRAADERCRLQAALPHHAIPDRESSAVGLLMAVALAAEGWLTYAALSATLPEQPVPLLLASLVAAPLAALLMHRAGTLARRATWSQALRWQDGLAIAVCLIGPSVLGVGIVLSRLGAIPDTRPDHRLATVAVGAGLQACLLGLPGILGWLSADPVPGLSAAAAREARLTAQLARTVRQLQEDNERERRFEQQLDARLNESLSALDYWWSVYCPPALKTEQPERVNLRRPNDDGGRAPVLAIGTFGSSER